MRKLAFILTLILTLALCTALPAAAQAAQEETAQVKGTIVSADGKPVVNAVVEFTNTSGVGGKYTTKTDKEGSFVLDKLPAKKTLAGPATYKATLKQDGKEVWASDGLVLEPGQTMPLNIKLYSGKLTEEQKKEQEQAAKENEKIKAENEKIKGLNGAMSQARADLSSIAQLQTDDEKTAKITDAINIMKTATENAPNYDLGWFVLGDAYAAGKKWPEAIESYSKAISTTKMDKAAFHNQLGRAYANAGQADKAVPEFDNAAKLDPVNAAMYYYNAGAVLTNLKKLDEANVAFDKAIAADPKKADAYFLKASNLLNKAVLKDDKMVAPDGTSEALNKYLELQPNGPHAPEAKAMLEAIGAPVETKYGKAKKGK